jgi:hypothetical protein
MREIPQIAGGVDAYEFHVEVCLHFHCDDCGAHLECEETQTDAASPFPPWATREGKRGMMLGWYVPPLTSDGSLSMLCFCPDCTRKRGLHVSALEDVPRPNQAMQRTAPRSDA